MEHNVEKNKETPLPKSSPTPQLEEDPSTEEEFKQSLQEGTANEQATEKLYYRIGEAAKLLKIEKHVIRYWEKEFEIDTHRSSSGQRLYRRVEIETLQKIKSLILKRLELKKDLGYSNE